MGDGVAVPFSQLPQAICSLRHLVFALHRAAQDGADVVGEVGRLRHNSGISEGLRNVSRSHGDSSGAQQIQNRPLVPCNLSIDS